MKYRVFLLLLDSFYELEEENFNTCAKPNTKNFTEAPLSFCFAGVKIFAI